MPKLNGNKMRKITSKHILSIIIFGATAILGIFAAEIVKSMTIETNRVAPNSVVKPQNSIALMQGPPQSLEEFVQKSEVIVIGRISRFTKEGFEGSYWSTDIQDNRNVPKMPLHPFSYFDLEIVQVIANPHEIPLPSAVSIRHGGLYSTRAETYWDPPYYEIGDQKLYGIHRNPDGTWGTHGSWWSLNIEGDVVTFPDRAHTPIKFTDKISPNAFIQAVKAESAKK